MKLSFIHLIRFRVDNARVFERVCMNLSTTVGQAACRVANYCVQGSHSVISNTLRLYSKWKTHFSTKQTEILICKRERMKIPEVKSWFT